MKFIDYKEIIKKTAKFPTSLNSRSYCLMGLFGEFVEFLEKRIDPSSSRKDLKKELGDVFWYLTALCSVLGSDVMEIIPTAELSKSSFTASKNRFIINYGKLSEVIKKVYRDNNSINKEINDVFLRSMMLSLYNLSTLSGFTVEEVLETNYNKLIKRRETNTLLGSGDNREEIIVV